MNVLKKKSVRSIKNIRLDQINAGQEKQNGRTEELAK